MLIGLTGRIDIGKTTLAQYLVESYGFERMAFADPMKESFAALFNMTVDQVNDFKDNNGFIVMRGDDVESLVDMDPCTRSFRELLQRYGTEAHRDIFGQDFWVDQMAKRIAKRVAGNSNVRIIIDDIRFPNEIHLIRDYFNSYIWHLRDKDYLVNPDLDDHISERPLPVKEGDRIFLIDKYSTDVDEQIALTKLEVDATLREISRDTYRKYKFAS